MDKKIVIWDLMGGGCNSLRLALKNAGILSNFNVFTFDIVKESNGFKNIVADLSQDNILDFFDNLIKKGKIEKPDFLISSPLCQSFSVAMQSISTLLDSKGKPFSGNPHHYWDYECQLIKRWPANRNIKWNGFSGNSYPKGSKSVPKYIGELGERCIQNIIKIICHYQPQKWYIENPAKSMMWKFIEYNLGFKGGKLNIAHYSAYNSLFSRKPTGFLSNIDLALKTSHGGVSVNKIDDLNYQLVLSGACKDKAKDELKRQRAEAKLRDFYKNPNIKVSLLFKKNAMERSHIPNELLISIINKFIETKPCKKIFKSKNIVLTPWTNNKQPKITDMRKDVTI